MVKSCCVCTCPSESYRGCNISFHSFPKNEEIRQKWLSNVKVKQNITKNSVMCSHHFKPSCFYTANSRRLLKSNAVPTISPGQVVKTDDDSFDEDEEDNKNLLMLKKRLASGSNHGSSSTQVNDDTNSGDEKPQKFEMVIPSCNSTTCNSVESKKAKKMKSMSTQANRPTDGEAALRQRVKVLGMRLKRRDAKIYYLKTVLNMIKKNFKGTDMEYKLSCELENIANFSESTKSAGNRKSTKTESPVDDCVNDDEESSGDENGTFYEDVLSPNLRPQNVVKL